MFSMILDILSSLVKIIFSLLKYPAFVICLLLIYWIGAIYLHIYSAYRKGFRFKKGSRVVLKPRRWIQKAFIDFPKQYAQDLMDKEPDFFQYQGMYMFTGRQGRGKSIAEVEFILRMQKEYPRSKVLTNFGYVKQDVELKHWRQLIDYKNGKYGVIVGIDETQNWFSSNASKDFPEEMLEVVTQNRKNRRVIVGTAQNFYLLAKGIRTQTSEVRECFTAFGCVTFVRCREPILNEVGEVVEWKNRGIYWFVHNKEIREAYDTYRVIHNLGKSGFQKKAPQPVVINTNFSNAK